MSEEGFENRTQRSIILKRVAIENVDRNLATLPSDHGLIKELGRNALWTMDHKWHNITDGMENEFLGPHYPHIPLLIVQRTLLNAAANK